MARSLAALKKNLVKTAENLGEISKRVIYYGFIPGLIYLGFSTEPKPNLKALLGYS
jgi:hypothetical protein